MMIPTTQYLYHYRGDKNLNDGLSFSNQKDAIKTFIRKQLLSPNLNFFIGSGCSFPAVPLMGKTFKSLKKDLHDAALGNYRSEENDDIEGYLNWLHTSLNFFENSDIDYENIGEFQENYERTKKGLIESIDINYYEHKDVLNFYKEFYNEIFSIRNNKDFSPVNVFTTNYDLFNELAMENANIRYTNGFRGTIQRIFDPTEFHLRLVDDVNRYKDKWSIVRRFVKLYKIHGSIDWLYDSKIGKVVQRRANEDESENVLIYPTIHKHIETQQTPYSELFREFSINLQKPNSTLVVMGYGFPDQHINQLISQALSNEDFTLIIFSSLLEDKAKEFFENHKALLNIHFIGGRMIPAEKPSDSEDGHHFRNILSYMKACEGDD